MTPIQESSCKGEEKEEPLSGAPKDLNINVLFIKLDVEYMCLCFIVTL